MATTKFIEREQKNFEVQEEFPVRGPTSHVNELITGFYAAAFYPIAFYTGHVAFDIDRSIIHVPPNRLVPRPHTAPNTSMVRK